MSIPLISAIAYCIFLKKLLRKYFYIIEKMQAGRHWRPCLHGNSGNDDHPSFPLSSRFRVLWRQQGSNLRPHACDACALPAELCLRHILYHKTEKLQALFLHFENRNEKREPSIPKIPADPSVYGAFRLFPAVCEPLDIAGVHELLDLAVLHEHQRRRLHDPELIRKLRILLRIDHLIIHAL